MISTETFRKSALSFPEVTEQPHFEKPSFRVHKKIFATIDLSKNQGCLKLSLADQDAFSIFDKSIIFPVPNKWGQQGWTFVNLQTVPEEMFIDALKAAYCHVAPKKLAVNFRSDQSENLT